MSRPADRRKLAVVAVGGNALITDAEHQQISDQSIAADRASGQVAALIAAGWRVVLTHGNAPQVGFILRRSEIAIGEVPPVPMDYAGADTQGAIGYMFQRAIGNHLAERGLPRRVVAMVTQVLVEAADPAFGKPTKPVGAYLDAETVQRLARERGWVVREEHGRGWRRVVPSPEPREIIELGAICTLVDDGFTVIACGGGGIPVVADGSGDLTGIEAVIDKDLVSALLARELGADALVITTGVERVAIGFATPEPRWLDAMSVTTARRYLAAGEFPPGSMGPKVRAVADFVAAGGGVGMITSVESLAQAFVHGAGTRIVADDEEPGA